MCICDGIGTQKSLKFTFIHTDTTFDWSYDLNFRHTPSMLEVSQRLVHAGTPHRPQEHIYIYSFYREHISLYSFSIYTCRKRRRVSERARQKHIDRQTRHIFTVNEGRWFNYIFTRGRFKEEIDNLDLYQTKTEFEVYTRILCVCLSHRVCVCVCEREREIEREFVCVFVCVCVFQWCLCVPFLSL